MDPNATNPNNTPAPDETAPVTPPATETPVPETSAPVTPEALEAPASSAPAEESSIVDDASPAPAPLAEASEVPEGAPESTPEATPEVAVEPVMPEEVTSTQPSTFAAPTTDQTPTVPGMTPAPAGQPFYKKKPIIIGAIAGAAVLVLSIVGAILFFMLTTVSEEDYRAAATQYNEVSRASSSLMSDVTTLSYTTSSASDDDFAESVSDTEASIAEIQSANDELAKLKAVKFGDGAGLYSTFDDKLEAYLEYASDLVTSVKNLRPALVVCANISDANDTSERVAALKDCSTKLGGITDIPNAEMKKFVDTAATAYSDYADVYEKIAALTNPYGSQYEEYKVLRDEMYDIQDTISDAADTMSDELDAREDALSVRESANALGDFLTEQQ